MLQTDYLIIGSGAVGMAFADTLLTETTEDTIIIIDKYAKPGGHWNVAYPFVTLHQPSAFYGVPSLELSKGFTDKIGLNKGLGDLATGAEILAYYDQVMRQTFLPSGRVQYFPLCEYQGDGKVVSLLTGATFQIQANKKIVDATYLKTSVPATHTPNFCVADGVRFMPLNDLPNISIPPSDFVVIGGGKTGIDACLWLLENRVEPDKITWIVSRDAWLLDRRNTQITLPFFEYSIGSQAAQFEAIAQSSSIDDMFDRLENAGVFVRIDKNVRPRMFHGATVSEAELVELRRIKNVVRMGRVQSIESDKIILAEGSIPTTLNTVHVDCSASALVNLGMKPIFQGNLITPQTVRSYQPIFSASFIAHIEVTYDSEKRKNQICGVVPLPNHATDWVNMMMAMMMNQYNWRQEKDLRDWLINNRLDGFAKLLATVDREDEDNKKILKKMKENIGPAMKKLQIYFFALQNEKQVA